LGVRAEFEIPYNQTDVFNSIPKAIENLKWRLEDLDHRTFSFRAKTKWSFWGWASKLEGNVNEIDPHHSRLRIEGKITKQLIDEGVTKERIIQFMNELEKLLSSNDKTNYEFYRPFTGTGRTKNNSIVFTDASDPHEHIQLQYEYMQFNGIISKLQAMDNQDKDEEGKECVYNWHDTNVGKLWFKHPPIFTASEINSLLDKIDQKKKAKNRR
jgi:hypothetical protein